MMTIEAILISASTLVVVSILASKVSGRLGVPALLIFLVVGMLAGSEGPGGIYFDNALVVQFLGVVALALILFAGGLDTRWSIVRPLIWTGARLSTLGVFITAILTGVFASRVLGFSLKEGMLLGAVVSSTDAAAVFSVLRSRNITLRKPLRPLLELESGSNDPMAVFLTLGFIQLVNVPSFSFLDLIPMFFRQMILGGVLGYGMGRLMIWVLNRVRLEYEGLYTVLSLSLSLLTYGITAVIGGNGFLAIYLAGITMGNREFIHKRGLMRFHDGLAWLMQITMFLTLGLQVFPSRLVPIAGVSLLIAGFLTLVARPVSVFLALVGTGMPLAEKLLISWVGLRGAAPIILATFPLLAGIRRSDMIFDVVFFIVLTSALLQGTSIPRVSKWLRLDIPEAPEAEVTEEPKPKECLRCRLEEIEIAPDSPVVGTQIVEADLPEEALILLIRRENMYLTPTGGTILHSGDRLLVLAEAMPFQTLKAMLQP